MNSLYNKCVTYKIDNFHKFYKDSFKETLNKSRLKAVCTSCLHIFRQLAQKILVMRQHYCGLFVQPDKKSDGAICTNDLISVSLKIKNPTACIIPNSRKDNLFILFCGKLFSVFRLKNLKAHIIKCIYLNIKINLIFKKRILKC